MRFSFTDGPITSGPRAAAASSFTAGACALACILMLGMPVTPRAQGIDCGRLQAAIAQLDHGGGGARYAAAARRQAGELARTQAYAHQLGCDGFSFFGGGNPQCGGLTGRIQQMQANLQQLQAAGGGGSRRNDLVARYNAECRGAPPPQPRGFFESLFGGPAQEPRQGPLPEPPPPHGQRDADDEDDGGHARGGSQAVCVRTCDGGFFPLGVSSRRKGDSLVEMCQALCPGTDTAVFTRNPDNDIKTAVGLDGKPYMELPNALKYQKSFSSACSCRTAGKSWAETLANAEQVLDNVRKGDIIVTKEKSDELSRPNLDAKTRARLIAAAPATKVAPADAAKIAGDAADGDTTDVPTAAPAAPTQGGKRPVRRVGPQL